MVYALTARPDSASVATVMSVTTRIDIGSNPFREDNNVEVDGFYKHWDSQAASLRRLSISFSQEMIWFEGPFAI
jgi:hypothetical protein